MPKKLVSISLFGALLVASLLLAIDGYQNISNFTGWCIAIIPSEHTLSFTNACNTEYLAALIAGVVAASIATFGLIETTSGHFDLFRLTEVKEELARLPMILGLLGFAFLFVFFVPVVPNPTLYGCSGGGTFGGLCLGDAWGLESLGYLVLSWGAVYGFEPGYFAPMVSFPGWGATGVDLMIFCAFPISCASTLLLSREIARRNRWLLMIPVILTVLLFFSPLLPGFNNV